MEKEIKDLRSQVASAKSTKRFGSDTSGVNDEKVKIIEAENEKLRWQVAEKERKMEELNTKISKMENGTASISSTTSSSSSTVDTKKQLKMVEHEAGMLRQKLLQIE